VSFTNAINVFIYLLVVFNENIFPFSKLPEYTSSSSSIDVSALLIPSPTSLTGHYDNATIPTSISTNLPADIPDGSMPVANGGTVLIRLL
jgi:hypothetical protein